MSVSLEKTGRSVQEAIRAALDELQVSEDKVLIEVLDEGSEGGILGIGRKDARVLVTLEEDPVTLDKLFDYGDDAESDDFSADDDTEELALSFLEKLLDGIGVSTHIEVSDDKDTVYIDIDGDDVGVAIGRHGETLDAIQYITGLVVNRNSQVKDPRRVVVDISGYKKRRQKSLESQALRIAGKVIKVGKSYEMEPMNPAQRRIVHCALQDFPGVTTFSEGREPDRCVIISPVRD